MGTMVTEDMAMAMAMAKAAIMRKKAHAVVFGEDD